MTPFSPITEQAMSRWLRTAWLSFLVSLALFISSKLLFVGNLSKRVCCESVAGFISYFGVVHFAKIRKVFPLDTSVFFLASGDLIVGIVFVSLSPFARRLSLELLF